MMSTVAEQQPYQGPHGPRQDEPHSGGFPPGGYPPEEHNLPPDAFPPGGDQASRQRQGGHPPGGHRQGGAPPGGQSVDAEQYRQFQEFLRFQEFQKSQGGGGRPAAPAGNGRRPLWLRALRIKAVRRLIYLLVLLLIGSIAYQYYFGEDPPPPTGGGGPAQAATPVLPQTPKDTVRAVYHYLPVGRADTICALFTKDAAQTFARNLGAPNCDEAVKHAKNSIKDVAHYQEPGFPDAAVLTSGRKSQISSCAMTVTSSDRLGAFMLTQQDNGGWIISGHRNEPADCLTG